ncbi:MAG: DUF58 domain-containing protein [Nocardioidaceae bacterium]
MFGPRRWGISGAPNIPCPCPGAPWTPTHAYLRAAALGGALLVAAVVFRDPGLAVVATPFLTITAWSLGTRPSVVPNLRQPRSLPVLREGESMRWQVQLEAVAGLEQAAVLMERAEYQQLRPPTGACAALASTGQPTVALALQARSIRWGMNRVCRALICATSPWGAFRWGTVELPALEQTTLPLPAVFDAAAPTPHPIGLVGLNRSARRGEGSEFATIRPFAPGDRLRRIHWPVSLRSRALHVASTWADQDAEVMLLVDASTDLGTSEGIDGFASSLDVTVRAAGAVAEHFLRHGDRVGLCVFGPDLLRLSPSAGRTHLRKVLTRLAATTVGNRDIAEGKLLRLRLGANTMVVMLSACSSELALRQAATFAARGLSVVVVDTLPLHLGGMTDPSLTVAWRIRRLERENDLRELNRRGIPVVAWRGPGSLDLVLRDLSRRGSAPTLARR